MRLVAQASSSAIAAALGATRIALGAGIWLAPDLAMRVLGFDPRNAESRALGRLAGTRDAILGVLAVGSLDEPRAARAMALANAWVDAGDAAAFGLALVRREGIDRAALMGATSATAASATGFWLARRLQSGDQDLS
jgi:hypothetical protein